MNNDRGHMLGRKECVAELSTEWTCVIIFLQVPDSGILIILINGNMFYKISFLLLFIYLKNVMESNVFAISCWYWVVIMFRIWKYLDSFIVR